MAEPTREQLAQDYATALTIIDRLRTSNAELLTSCKEVRDALAGAMRVVASTKTTAAFLAEMNRIGIADGIGVRADAAIKKAESVDVGVIRAPFTPAQVAALNRFQIDKRFHPFTCDKCRAVLVAFPEGWRCTIGELPCDYTQDWAHAFMARHG